MLAVDLVNARSGFIHMRFADMVMVFSPGRRKAAWLPGLPAWLAWVLVSGLLAPGWCLGQAQPPPNTKAAAPPPAQKKAGAGQEKAKAEADDDDQAKGDKKGDEAPGEPPPDPSKTQKVAPVEVFKDPNAEEILDLKKFNPIRRPFARPAEIEAVKLMAQDPNAPVDPTEIRRMVGGMVAQLTDTRNIQGLIDPPRTRSPPLPPPTPSRRRRRTCWSRCSWAVPTGAPGSSSSTIAPSSPS